LSHITDEGTEKNSVNTFAGRVKKIRKALKITQKELAARLDISGAALSEIEKGKYKPGHDFFFQIARVCHVNLYYLLFGQGEMFMDASQLYDMGVETLPTQNADIKRFLWYFQRSSILQYNVLSHFLSLLKKEEKVINAEANEYEERIKRNKD
jgi:transcriptional regulator with XRE-family HTH domain